MDDTQWRLFIFMSVLVLMACAETLFPKKDRALPRGGRWFTNVSLVVINTLCLKLLGPISAVIAADIALDNSWGLFAFSPVPLPLIVEIIIAVIALDFAIYWQHVATHKIPFLWRLHRVHHVDRDIDVTTGIRFHPIEVILSMFYKCGVILLLGPLPIAVIIYEIVLNGFALFNHANVKLTEKVDNVLRKVIVTPDFHRIHHSEIQTETDSNYGNFLSLWDRSFHTYIAYPEKGHEGMTIGLKEYQTDKPAKLTWSLQLPFKFNKR